MGNRFRPFEIMWTTFMIACHLSVFGSHSPQRRPQSSTDRYMPMEVISAPPGLEPPQHMGFAQIEQWAIQHTLPMMPSKTAEHIRQQHKRIVDLQNENLRLRVQMGRLQKENNDLRKENDQSSKSESEALKLAISVKQFELQFLSERVEEKRNELR